MLSKIFNISAGSDYKNSKKNIRTISRPFLAYKGYDSDKFDFADLSPALLFLKELKWKLKEVSHPCSNSYHLVFFINDIKFDVKINQAEQPVYFEVSKETDSGNAKMNIIIELSINPFSNFSSEYSGVNFLELLFEKIAAFNAKINLKKNEDSLMNSLFEGFEDELGLELNSITINIIHFIEKMDSTIIRFNEKKVHNFLVISSISTDFV